MSALVYFLVTLTLIVKVVQGQGPSVLERTANHGKLAFDKATYEFTVHENVEVHTEIGRVHAECEDGSVEYSFIPKTQEQHGNMFEVDSTTGMMYSKGKIDYELLHDVTLWVIAATASSKVYAKVHVTIMDENDNSPKIKVQWLAASGGPQVKENTPPGVPIAQVTVDDRDSGLAGMFDCAIANSNFELEQLLTPTDFKLVTTTTFDREEEESEHISIMCLDHGPIPHLAGAQFDVLIVDENDHSPVFEKSDYYAEITENNLVGASITQVQATDEDSGANALIQYSLMDGLDMVTIEPNTGIIRAKVIFDYEQMNTLEIQILAIDQGEPSRISEISKVHLKILNKNDEAPEEEQSFREERTRSNVLLKALMKKLLQE